MDGYTLSFILGTKEGPPLSMCLHPTCGHRISTVEQREVTFIARLYGCSVCQPTITQINAQPLLAPDSVRFYPYTCHYTFYYLSGGSRERIMYGEVPGV